MTDLPDPLAHRTADHEIEPLFLRRWSPRAMAGTAVAQPDLDRLLEAARWAPSSYNEQEWRFRYAHRDGPHWETLFGLLVEANQVWCRNAGVLVTVFAKKTFTRNGKPNPVHAFDAGAAFQNLCLQGASMGLVVHGMAGFDRERASADLAATDDFVPLAMVAIGHPGSVAGLPEKLQGADRRPSGRNKITEWAGEGPFGS